MQEEEQVCFRCQRERMQRVCGRPIQDGKQNLLCTCSYLHHVVEVLIIIFFLLARQYQWSMDDNTDFFVFSTSTLLLNIYLLHLLDSHLHLFPFLYLLHPSYFDSAKQYIE